MISLPPGFDVGLYVSELFSLAAPFVGIAVLITCAVYLKRAMKR
jgi:hypothetical protein